ncbi:MAG: hypothetical protein U1C97_01000 [Candidatus Gracilibacteria bacterium]|nr:hypothetical protein [bacterium]MDZ4216879.1 hypothetical protein [Candidatus Gracilibacteria bacterium]
MTPITRPWQGTVLAVMGYASAIYNTLAAAAVAFGLSFMGFLSGGFIKSMEGGESAEQVAGVASTILSGFGFVLALLIFIGAIISYIIARAFWTGKHWPITLGTIVGGLIFIIALGSIDPLTIILTGIPVALCVSIWKHPFYNQKTQSSQS